MKERYLKHGDRIIYTYEHSLNSRSKKLVQKAGLYLGRVNHTKAHWKKIGAEQMVVVHLSGNKKTSIVPSSKITDTGL